MRPLLGQPVVGTAIKNLSQNNEIGWSIAPNPTSQFISIQFKELSKLFVGNNRCYR